MIFLSFSGFLSFVCVIFMGFCLVCLMCLGFDVYILPLNLCSISCFSCFQMLINNVYYVVFGLENRYLLLFCVYRLYASDYRLDLCFCL